MNIIRGTLNRLIFGFTRIKLKSCGKNSLFESEYEVEGAKYISVGKNVRTKPRLHIAAIDEHNGLKFTPRIEIGDDVSINYDVHISAIDRVIIGKGSLLASKIFITDHFHGDSTRDSLIVPPSKRLLVTKGPVIIGENVWIGESVAIMPGVTIGNNSVVGANSIVTSDIPDFSVAVGSPARIIKRYEV